MISSRFFSPGKLGPLTLRNRSIRAAAFEGMSAHHNVTEALIAYHTAVAKGGTGMTTVAYASVNKSGLSFEHQLWLRKEIIPQLRKLTDSIHREGAAASIQIGHCGNMANSAVTATRPLAPSGGINWYGPTIPRRMSKTDIAEVIADFRNSVRIAAESGFDAVEVHAGHGYLISQFLSPYTNKRNDEYGGSFENRSRFMREVLTAVREKLPPHMALLVKMNCWDGFEGGITKQEAAQTARIIEQCGAHAIVVSGGFVSRAPMYVMRGSMPIDVMAHFIREPFKRFFVKHFGKQLIPSLPFSEGYFMEEAKSIQKEVTIPVVLVGGMNSITTIEKAINEGFEWIAIARALIENPNFVNDLKNEVIRKSACTICNYCVAKMYTEEMACHLHQSNIPEALKPKIAALANG
ncbi:MAG: NADH:flavin oxidoreductase [Chitinophagales bacterium]|nr:NADH:flavin oxidoreductase [Chitinophagales bacterium]